MLRELPHPGERTRHENTWWHENTRGLLALVALRDEVSLSMAALFCDIIRAADEKDFARVGAARFCAPQFKINGNLELAWKSPLMPDPSSLRLHKYKLVAAVAKSKARGSHRFSAFAEPKAAALSEWKKYESMAKLKQDAQPGHGFAF